MYKEDDIRLLIREMLIQQVRRKQSASFSEPQIASNKEIEWLEMHDYLKLMSHQKKNLPPKRWKKLLKCNQDGNYEQQDFHYFVLIATQANYRQLDHPGYYKQLVKMIESYPPQFFSCIYKDVPRTLHDAHPHQIALKNVLCAYAVRNPSLLYCQGMNYIITFMLMNGLSEQQAFWFLVSLVEEVLPENYFKDLAPVTITSQIFRNSMELLFPEFAAEMQDVGMENSLFLVTWYVCIFTKGFINSVSQYLLSIIILNSRKYSIGFTILKISLGIIYSVLDRDTPFTFQDDFKSFRDNLETTVYETSLEDIRKSLDKIQLNYDVYLKIENHYNKLRLEKQEEMIVKDLADGKGIPLPHCSLDYHMCLHRIEIEKKIGAIQEVFVTKSAYSIAEQCFENYWNDPSPITENKTNSYQEQAECLIARQTHICQEKGFIKMHSKMNKKMELKSAESEESLDISNQFANELEFKSHFSKMEDRFAELSEFFIVNEEEATGSQEEEQIKQKQTQSQIGGEKKDKKSSFTENVAIFVQQAFKKVSQTSRIFRKSST